MKIFATVKGDNREDTKNLLSKFFSNPGQRKIDIENDIIKVELEFDESPDASIIEAIGECGIITLHFDASENSEMTDILEINEESSLEDTTCGETEKEVTTGPETSETEAPESETTEPETAETDVTESESAESETTETEVKPKLFSVNVFPKLKNIIDSAQSDKDLAEKVSEFLNVGSKKGLVQEIFAAALKIPLKTSKISGSSITMIPCNSITKISWNSIRKEMPQGLSESEQIYCSAKVRKSVINYGYEPKSFLEVIKLIIYYYRNSRQCFEFKCISLTVTTGRNMTRCDKVADILTKMSTPRTFSRDEIRDIANLFLREKIDIASLRAETRMKISTIINKDLPTDKKVSAEEFLTEFGEQFCS